MSEPIYSDKWVEVERKNITENDGAAFDVVCDCGRTITLWFNGGELDAAVCECGIKWSLEAPRIDLVKYGVRLDAPDKA